MGKRKKNSSKVELAFDTETTGLLAPMPTELHLQPFITEIYVCKFDKKFRICAEFETFVRPPVPISEEITRITGITNEMVSTAPTFAAILPDLIQFFLGEETIYAHNCSFDIGVLLCELMRIGYEHKFPWPHNQICTVEASMPIKNKRMALGKLYGLATGKEMVNAHRAKGDVMAMVDCIEFLKENKLV